MSKLSASPVIDMQIVTTGESIPSEDDFKCWAAAALPSDKRCSEMTIRIVGTEESRELNGRYRNQDAATNVLSFPSNVPEGLSQELDAPYLGDLVICAPVVKTQAQAQNKAIDAHWAHLVVHGTLHLIGYDHLEDAEAEAMEALETRILVGLDFPTPYQ